MMGRMHPTTNLIDQFNSFKKNFLFFIFFKKRTLGHAVWVTHFYFYFIVFEKHVWVVLLNLNSTKVLFSFFQFCFKFFFFG
jgi:hypothetical protein